ncbi:PEPxxWA-CTERM sorting domain-containing protein [Duganella sp. FT134W]|uniref:PEPxxWA-CTERM sorting domain-containing protein n=1 Tax=Duganella margarita TaxID=2692170 RepID=A0A7X4H2H8_9BURK|nr:PEPxxWA-CTERM sorting domain-containing protein [Duganella margarita]MYM74113.1 PEPxxWA-CTERM sorting domain-containing protein [Duganella margarita]
MRIKSILLSLSAVAALSAGVANASTNLVTNGDFNQTTNGNNNQVGYTAGVAGETMLTGWTSYNGNNGGYNFVLNDSQVTTDQSVKWLKSSYTPLTSGGNNFFASDAVYYPGVLSQTVTGLTSGDKYTLSFNYALAQQVGFDGANANNYWKVLFGDAVTVQQIQTSSIPVGTQSKDSAALSIASGGFSGWQTATMTFTAQSASQVLSFLAEGTAPGAPPFLLLDNVSLAAVPEPTTWGMMLGGMGLLGFMARRRAAKRA